MNKRIALAFMTMLLLSFAVVAQEKEQKKAGQKEAEVTEQKPAPAPEPASEEYVIGPEDVLHINVWKEPELSGQVAVRPDGKISLALLNDLQAAGCTPLKLAADIGEKLKQYVTDPRVTVTVAQMNSRRIFIMGEVGRAGAFPMLPNMTLMQAFSSAGGFSPFAKIKKIYMLRTENGKQTKMPINYKALISGSAPELNIRLKPGDTIVVP
ncbi:MAG: polysaccharide biosynthesis/export family protein [Acidobacteriia bacterium]|nr:polysaccharide biosynthesis/export family protein [Terriglobia bacterium]